MECLRLLNQSTWIFCLFFLVKILILILNFCFARKRKDFFRESYNSFWSIFFFNFLFETSFYLQQIMGKM